MPRKSYQKFLSYLLGTKSSSKRHNFDPQFAKVRLFAELCLTKSSLHGGLNGRVQFIQRFRSFWSVFVFAGNHQEFWLHSFPKKRSGTVIELRFFPQTWNPGEYAKDLQASNLLIATSSYSSETRTERPPSHRCSPKRWE